MRMVGLRAPHLPPTIPVMVPFPPDSSETRGGVLMFWDSESRCPLQFSAPKGVN